MFSKRVVLSVVCPAYNEEDVLPLFHQELNAVLDALEVDYRIEIIYVDDGSRDGTLEFLRERSVAESRVRYLSFSRNFGHQAALSAGMEMANGDVVITMDCDLQHPPALIPQLLAQWRAGYDLVLTIRENEATGWLKRLSSRCFYRVMRLLSDTEIRSGAADFRLMSRRALDSLLQMREAHRFLRGMVHWLGFPSTEVHFTVGQRRAGQSKYNLRRMLAFAADGMISFSKTPLRLTMLVGLLFAMGGLGTTGFLLVRSLGSSSRSHPSLGLLFGSLYIIGGAILFAIGIVGEYVGRIYEQVKARPHYVVKESSCRGRRADHWPRVGPSYSDTEARAA